MKVSIVTSADKSFCWNYATDTFHGNYVGDNVCCIYADLEVVLFVTGMLVDPSAIVQATVSVEVMLLEVSAAHMQVTVSAAHMQVTVSAANMWVTFSIVIMQMVLLQCIMHLTVSIVIMQLSLSFIAV